MSITVKSPQQPEKLGIKEDIKLKVRKTMGDQLVVEDHPDVDIVIYPDSNKILALAKHRTNEEVYDTQDRLFLLLRNEGIVQPETVHAGFVYGSMEGQMFVNEDHDMVQVALYGINKFIVDEKIDVHEKSKYKFEGVHDYIEEPWNRIIN